MRKGDGITKPMEIPINDFKKKIKSYHALYEDGRIQDLTEEEHVQFCQEANFYYGELDSDERKKCNEVKDEWEYISPYV